MLERLNRRGAKISPKPSQPLQKTPGRTLRCSSTSPPFEWQTLPTQRVPFILYWSHSTRFLRLTTHQMVAVIISEVALLCQEVTEMLAEPTSNEARSMKVPSHRGLEDVMDEDRLGELGSFRVKMRA